MSSNGRFSIGDSVWYDGQYEAVVSEVLDGGEDEDYTVVFDDGDRTEDVLDEDLQDRQSTIDEDIYDHFGGFRVDVSGGTAGDDAGVHFNLSSQGSGSNLSAEEAREVAEALRAGESGLTHLIEDDLHEVAAAFEEAADVLDDFNNPSPPSN